MFATVRFLEQRLAAKCLCRIVQLTHAQIAHGKPCKGDTMLSTAIPCCLVQQNQGLLGGGHRY